MLSSARSTCLQTAPSVTAVSLPPVVAVDVDPATQTTEPIVVVPGAPSG